MSTEEASDALDKVLSVAAQSNNRLATQPRGDDVSTKATLAHRDGDLSWHLYEEVFEPGVVYLDLNGIPVELVTREDGGADVVLRLPIETAE